MQNTQAMRKKEPIPFFDFFQKISNFFEKTQIFGQARLSIYIEMSEMQFLKKPL